MIAVTASGGMGETQMTSQSGRLGRRLLVRLVELVLVVPAGALLELVDAATERPAKVAELARPEKNHEDDQDNDELERTKRWHRSPPRRAESILPSRSVLQVAAGTMAPRTS